MNIIPITYVIYNHLYKYKYLVKKVSIGTVKLFIFELQKNTYSISQTHKIFLFPWFLLFFPLNRGLWLPRYTLYLYFNFNKNTLPIHPIFYHINHPQSKILKQFISLYFSSITEPKSDGVTEKYTNYCKNTFILLLFKI